MEQCSPLTAACANLAIFLCFSCSWSMAVLRWSREELNPAHREERACNAALQPASSSCKPRWDLEGRLTLMGIGAGTGGGLTEQAPVPQHHCHTAQREAAPDCSSPQTTSPEHLWLPSVHAPPPLTCVCGRAGPPGGIRSTATILQYQLIENMKSTSSI